MNVMHKTKPGAGAFRMIVHIWDQNSRPGLTSERRDYPGGTSDENQRHIST